MPSEKRKADNRIGTIQEGWCHLQNRPARCLPRSSQDDDYISFLESLNKAANADETINPDNIEPTALRKFPFHSELNNHGSQPHEDLVDDAERTTPLLEALKAEKEASKDAANIIRYHPHYGAPSKLGPGGSRAKDRAQKEDDSTFSRSNEPNPPAVKAKDAKNAASSKDPVSGDGPAPFNVARSGPMSKKQAQKAKNSGANDAQPNQNSTPRANKSTKNQSNSATPQQAKPDRSNARPVQDSAEPSGSTVIEDTSSAPVPPREPGTPRERKRPAGNQRMFEAAVAGAMGGAPKEKKPRPERSEEADKDKEAVVRGYREKGPGGNRGGRHPPQPRTILTRDNPAAPSSNPPGDAVSSLQPDTPNNRPFVSGQPQPPQIRSEIRREAIPTQSNAESDKPAGPPGVTPGNNGHSHPSNNSRGRRGRGFRGGPFGRGRGGAGGDSNHERRVDTG